jgi:hypothetical protein
MEIFCVYEIKNLNELQSLPLEEREKKNNKKQNIDRAVKLNKAVKNGSKLFQCPVCMENKLSEEVISCSLNHQLCKLCLRAALSAGIESGNSSNLCQCEENCKGIYGVSIITEVLLKEELTNFNKLDFNMGTKFFGNRFPVCYFFIYLFIYLLIYLFIY